MRRIKCKNYILRVVAALAVLPLFSCEHKGISGSIVAEVNVVFDWKNAPDAKPEGMRVYLLPVDGGAYEEYEIANYEGGKIKVPEGTYRAVCVNSDTESVLFRGYGSYDEFEAYAPEGSVRSDSRKDAATNESLASSPDALYSGYIGEEFTIKLTKKDQTITFYPEFTECRYKVTITDVTNLKYTTSSYITGTLSGLSGGYMLGSGEFTTDAVSMCFNVETDGESTITAEFMSFGNADTSLHELVLYVTMLDGNKAYFSFDVTRQVNKARNPQDVSIELSGLELPKPIANGSGFHPTVDEWEEIEIDIPMGSGDGANGDSTNDK